MSIPSILRQTTKEMANRASVPMDVWDKHSNAALQAADRIEALEVALFDALSGLRYVRANYPEVSGVGFDQCEGYQSFLSEYRK